MGYQNRLVSRTTRGGKTPLKETVCAPILQAFALRWLPPLRDWSLYSRSVSKKRKVSSRGSKWRPSTQGAIARLGSIRFRPGWEVSTGKERLQLKASLDNLWSLALSPDGLTIASGA